MDAVARWLRELQVDPLPALLAAGDEALSWRTRHDLLGERADSARLWELPEAAGAVRRQRPDGSWSYRGRRARPGTAYDLLATYEALLPLVAKHGLDERHAAVARAAEYLLGFQSEEGDLRGLYGAQYSPNYTAAIVAVLLEAGHPDDDERIERALRWLLALRQDDGGWAIPFRTRTAAGWDEVSRLRAPLEPERSKPSSHFVTGIVLRALAAHPRLRRSPEARQAAQLLGSRLFRADAYPDRRAAAYWEKLRYPFRWTDVVSALDAMLLAGVGVGEPSVARALGWLAARQSADGLWRTPYEKAADRRIHHWVSFAAARVFRRAYGDC